MPVSHLDTEAFGCSGVIFLSLAGDAFANIQFVHPVHLLTPLYFLVSLPVDGLSVDFDGKS
ncbi:MULTISPECIES: hypothetical protein [Heyndrickxia]|uniref:hypothetical protein n=1 Tax=Heyndrickxia TaxID=2837504 RepID=UPI002DBEEFC5|nr:hypothetical protein [Weizmannia sp. CD-2023]MEC2303562.1 hypothetical protein [Weizmannia sp. CD-2023]MEC2340530.1 hypothetical protein [Weizmannia sp. CD-2023]